MSMKQVRAQFLAVGAIAATLLAAGCGGVVEDMVRGFPLRRILILVEAPASRRAAYLVRTRECSGIRCCVRATAPPALPARLGGLIDVGGCAVRWARLQLACGTWGAQA